MTKYILSIFLMVGAAAAAPSDVLDDAQIAKLRDADVIIVGETHDNPDHHAVQAKVAAALEPSAVVFEMLTVSQAVRVTPELIENEAELAETVQWEEAGWPDFSMYYPIFQAAKDADIFGAMIPRAQSQGVFQRGAADVFGRDADVYGLRESLPQGIQEARNALQMAAHCDALPPETLRGMVEVQRLRDASLARATVEALETTGGPVLVITGNGHARKDWGVPAYLSQVRPDAQVISIGQSEDGQEPPGGFDMVFDAPAPEREDPCAAFQ